MEQHDILRQTVATFLEMDPQQIHPALSFTGTRAHGSLARARLYAALQQRLGVQCQAVFTARTYEELHAAVFGTAAGMPETALSRLDHNAAVVSALSETTSLANSLACGMDIEMVDNLPVVQDYWEETFYTTTFTASEIAYCLLQNHPPMHFAARWCAKEALQKCDPAYSHVPMHQLEVALTPTGAPFLQAAIDGTWERLPVALSLSHTPHMAAAVVVKSSGASLASNGVKAPVVAPSPMAPVLSLPVSSMTPTARLSRRCLPSLLGVGALVVALWALVRTW